MRINLNIKNRIYLECSDSTLYLGLEKIIVSLYGIYNLFYGHATGWLPSSDNANKEKMKSIKTFASDSMFDNAKIFNRVEYILQKINASRILVFSYIQGRRSISLVNRQKDF